MLDVAPVQDSLRPPSWICLLPTPFASSAAVPHPLPSPTQSSPSTVLSLSPFFWPCKAEQVGLGTFLRLALHIYDANQWRSKSSECRVGRKGQVGGSGGAEFDLGRPGHVLLFVLLYWDKRAGAGKRWQHVPFEELSTVKVRHYLWALWWTDVSLRKVSGLMILNTVSLFGEA